MGGADKSETRSSVGPLAQSRKEIAKVMAKAFSACGMECEDSLVFTMHLPGSRRRYAMNRLDRGYSFEALRAKILFFRGAHKVVQERPKFERTSVGRNVMYDMLSYGGPSATEEVNYGVDIDKLVAMIEAGEI